MGGEVWLKSRLDLGSGVLDIAAMILSVCKHLKILGLSVGGMWERLLSTLLQVAGV